MKNLIFILIFFITTTTLFSQQIVWTKKLSDKNGKTQDISFSETENILLIKDSLSSTIIKTDSVFNPTHQTKYSRVFNNFVTLDHFIFTSFSENGSSGIQKIDSTGNTTKTTLLSGTSSNHSYVMNWIDEQILLVDNYEYSATLSFPRATVLSSNLEIDTSFFLPVNSGLHEYSATNLSDQKDIYLTGVKQAVPSTNLDQFLIRVDSTLDLESSRTFGTEDQDWIDVNHQSIVGFTSGAIIAGQTVSETDTNVTLSVVSKDDISFLHAIISSPEALTVSQKSLVYLGNQVIYILVNSSTGSHFLQLDFNGNIVKSFTFENNHMYTHLYLNNGLIYALGNSYISCINPNGSGENVECGLINSELFTSTVVTEDWQPTPYLLTPVFESSTTSFLISSSTENTLTLASICPVLSLSGEIKGCSLDTLCVTIDGDKSYTWYDTNDLENILSDSNNFCFTPQENISYLVKGHYGTELLFSPEVDLNESCIPDTIPIIYDFISPNNDNDNDEFYIENIEFIKPVSLKVVNQNNQIIYSEDNYQNNWIPTDVPNGTYFYQVRSSNFNQQGTLYIQR